MSRAKLVKHYRSILDGLYVMAAIHEVTQRRLDEEGEGDKRYDPSLQSEDLLNIGGNSIGQLSLSFTRTPSYLSLCLSILFPFSPSHSPSLTLILVAMQIVNSLRNQHIGVTYEDLTSAKFRIRNFDPTALPTCDEHVDKEDRGDILEVSEIEDLHSFLGNIPRISSINEHRR